MINLKEQLHEECTVHFRCGGSAVVEYSKADDAGFVHVYYDRIDRYTRYYTNGTLVSSGSHPFDIVKIDPKPFDWNDAKQKMAFKGTYGNVYYYIAQDFADESCVVVSSDHTCSELISVKKINLTRYPEGDLK